MFWTRHHTEQKSANIFEAVCVLSEKTNKKKKQVNKKSVKCVIILEKSKQICKKNILRSNPSAIFFKKRFLI